MEESRTFVFVKGTKNYQVYTETAVEGLPLVSVGNLYVSKEVLPDPPPGEIEVTVRVTVECA